MVFFLAKGFWAFISPIYVGINREKIGEEKNHLVLLLFAFILFFIISFFLIEDVLFPTKKVHIDCYKALLGNRKGTAQFW